MMVMTAKVDIKKVIIVLAAIAVLIIGIVALSAQEQFLGNWTTISDKTGEPAGIVDIYKDADGLYYGKLIGTYGSDKSAVGKMIIRGMKYENGTQIVCLNGEDLGDKIRTPEMSMYASAVSAIPVVRAFLLDTQRDIAKKNSVIMDGRDIGTVILPNAPQPSSPRTHTSLPCACSLPLLVWGAGGYRSY